RAALFRRADIRGNRRFPGHRPQHRDPRLTARANVAQRLRGAMTPERWEQIRATLEEVEAAASSDRAAVLERVGKSDPEALRQIEHILSGGLTDGAIRHAIAEQAASLRPEVPLLHDRFGP